MTRTVESIAGLRTLVVSMAGTPRAVVVVLHGYAMRPEDLAAFADSIGPRDLHDEHPAGAVAARALLIDVLAEVGRRHAGLRLVLVGFSQGGMLACDAFLRDRPAVSGLALLSASRISADEWTPLASRFGGLPILVSHGTDDPDLSFRAGEALRDLCASGGGEVPGCRSREVWRCWWFPPCSTIRPASRPRPRPGPSTAGLSGSEPLRTGAWSRRPTIDGARSSWLSRSRASLQRLGKARHLEADRCL